jgi:hypothetical protein
MQQGAIELSLQQTATAMAQLAYSGVFVPHHGIVYVAALANVGRPY